MKKIPTLFERIYINHWMPLPKPPKDAAHE